MVVAEGQVDGDGEGDGDDVGGDDDGAAGDQVLGGAVVALLLVNDAIPNHGGANDDLDKADSSH